MPAFLRSIGFSIFLIGVLEGFAEATAGLSKSYFGKRSDVSGTRLPFVQLGYALSAISKPMMALMIYPLWIFMARAIDRIGKGIRTGARDALLSDESTRENKAKVFGFHRSMDTLGAVFGPLIALLFLYYHPGHYTTLFLIAFIPGVAAIFLTFLIKEKRKRASTKIQVSNWSFFQIFSYWKISSREYKRLCIGLLAFALFNSSDAFLLLKMRESGISDTMVIAVYIFYNLIFALLAYPIGIIADKIGLKKIYLTGLFIFSLVYAGFAFNHNYIGFYLLFFLYGVYAAATEGISKAWISNVAAHEETATAIGTFTGLQSLCALVASSLTGFIWFRYGGVVTFMMSACVTILVIIYLSIFHSKSENIKINKHGKL